MAALLKHHGLELPVWDQETPVIYRHSDMDSAARSQDSFVRVTRIRGVGCKSLKQCLEIADAELVAVADRCDAKVIRHEWGLHKPPVSRKFYGLGLWEYPDGLLPPGFMLVADVDAIKDPEPVSTQQGLYIKLMSEMTGHVTSRRKNGSLTLDDMSASQFLLGCIRGETDVWLADIEPRLTDPV